MTSKIIKDMLLRFGCSVSVHCCGEVVSVAAVLQPLRYKNKVYVDGDCISAGELGGHYYLLISSPELRLDEYDKEEYVIDCAAMGKSFMLKSQGVYCLGNKPLYTWAILGENGRCEVN